MGSAASHNSFSNGCICCWIVRIIWSGLYKRSMYFGFQSKIKNEIICRLTVSSTARNHKSLAFLSKSEFFLLNCQSFISKSKFLLSKNEFFVSGCQLLILKSEFFLLKCQSFILKSKFLLSKNEFLFLKVNSSLKKVNSFFQKTNIYFLWRIPG
jgi:hypothetical protein